MFSSKVKLSDLSRGNSIIYTPTINCPNCYYHRSAGLEGDDATSKQQCVCVTSSIVSHLVQTQEVFSLQTGHSDKGDKRAPQPRQHSLFDIISAHQHNHCNFYISQYKYCATAWNPIRNMYTTEFFYIKINLRKGYQTNSLLVEPVKEQLLQNINSSVII